MKYHKYHSLPALAAILLFIAGCAPQSTRFELTNYPTIGHVDPFIGTAGDNGQVDPGACVPYAMVRIAPDMQPRSHSGYDYEVNRISGFSINRLSGIGCGGAGGNLSLRPAGQAAELSIVKESEQAHPGYYAVHLTNGVQCEFTATDKVGIYRFTYPEGVPRVATLDLHASFARFIEAQVVDDASGSGTSGFIHATNTCDHGAYKLHFNLTANCKWNSRREGERFIEYRFDETPGNTVEIRIALSPLGTAEAADENERISNEPFNRLRNAAAQAWESELGRIRIKATAQEKTLFYTNLYRVMLSPHNVTSADGRYLGTDGRTHTADGFTYYGSWSIWDTYHTKFPLIALLDAPRSRHIAHSLSHMYISGKRDWATKFEPTPTVRTERTSSVILDLYNKGAKDIPLAETVRAIRADLENMPTERPDQRLEGAIDVWALEALAQAANLPNGALANQTANQLFEETWTKEFAFVDSTYTHMRGSGLYQGTRWQYRWGAPQFLDRMAAIVGGKEVLVNQLDYYFTNNLFNQTNEVGINAAFIFNRLGRPELTHKHVHRILHQDIAHRYGGNAEYRKPVVGKPFTAAPRGYLPEMDEDDGTMGAWYVLATMGLFPLVPGEPVYELFSPSFEKIEIRPVGMPAITIKTTGRNSLADPVREVRFRGRALPAFSIEHDELMRGGTLEFIY